MVRGIFEDITGKKFGRLTAIKRVENDSNGNTQFLFHCDCGVDRILLSGNVRRGATRSCGCTMYIRKHNPDGCFNDLVRMYVFNAKSRNIEWLLTDDDVRTLTRGNCFYCNSSPSAKVSNGSRYYLYNGIDRIDNGIGYTKDNCITACKRCNYMRNKMSRKDFIIHAEKIANNWSWRKFKEREELNKDKPQMGVHFQGSNVYGTGELAEAIQHCELG